MKLYVRILLACGVVEYGVFCMFCLAGYLTSAVWYGVGGAWLALSSRFVKRNIIPPFFPSTRCHNCHEVIRLKARWSLGERFTDGKERHALRVYCNGEYEIGSFACPQCDSTIYLQKVTQYRLANWKIKDADSASASLPSTGDLILGTAKGSLPSKLTRNIRSQLKLPVGTPVCTNYETMTQHMTVFGKTGVGKSTLLISIVKRLMEQGEGVTVFDPDGDLAEDLLKFVPKQRLDDVVYFNIQDTKNPPPFNILNEPDSNDRNMLPDELIALFASLYSKGWGPNIAYMFRMAIRAAMEVDGSLRDVYDLLADSQKRHRIAAELKDAKLREFWEQGILNPKQQPARYALMGKLEELVEHPYIGPIISSKSCMFDADDVIRNKKILIVNLNTGTKPGAVLKIVGTFINSRMINAAYRQSRLKFEDRVQHFYFIDEFSNFVSSAFDWEQGLSKLRKYKMAFCFVTQYASSLPERIRDAIFGNAKILAAFCLGDKDAKALKDEFGCRSKRQLMKQPKFECRIVIEGETGSMRTIRQQSPLIDPAQAIKSRTQAAVQAFRTAENDVYRPQEQVDNEIKIIEQKAMLGELQICEFA